VDAFDRTINRIVAYIGHITGTGLLVCVCDDWILRKHALASLSARLGRSAQVLQFSYEIGRVKLLDFLAEVTQEEPKTIISIVGLETLPPDQLAEAIRSLNVQRNRFGRSGIILLFWVTERLLSRISSQASDFYSWRSETFFIEQPKEWDEWQGGLRRYSQELSRFLGEPDLQSALAIPGYERHTWSSFANRRLTRIPHDTQLNMFRDVIPGGLSQQATNQGELSVNPASLVRYPHAIVVGEPGIGKTTLLKYIALSLLRSALGVSRIDDRSQSIAALIPILINLGQIYSGETASIPVGEAAFRAYRTLVVIEKEMFDRLLRQGEIILLIDGFDEVPPALIHRIVLKIEQFTSEYPHCAVIIATRAMDSRALQKLEGWEWFRLEPLNLSEIFDFLDLTLDRPNAMNLLAMIQENHLLRSLAGSPLLLSLLSVLYQRRGSLALTPIEIYKNVVDLMLNRWEPQKGIFREEVDPLIVNEYLTEIAWWMQSHKVVQIEGKTLLRIASDIPRNGSIRLKESVSGFFRNIRDYSGLFLQTGVSFDGNDIFGFVHLTFQEFFAAKHLVGNWEKKGIPALLPLITDPWWSGVVGFAAAHLSPIETARFFQDLLASDHKNSVSAAARALSYGAHLSPAAEDHLLTQVLDILSSRELSWDAMNETTYELWRRMFEIRRPEFQQTLNSLLEKAHKNPRVRESVIPLLKKLSNDSNDVVRTAANNSLQQLQTAYPR
jgi:hypothetical protein